MLLWWKNPQRSKFGKFLDQNGIAQTDFAERANVSRSTIWRLCNRKDYIPTPVPLKKIMDTVRKIDENKQVQDFFDF
ncbi:helix-turn-helix transcriptional regulator [Priestia aryabhattai]|uniref:helix-turn-helix domain-containing protein n=1 Tax=Priestia aryabhattai TaxID=412384 RepID=UPI001C0E89FC|nr:helix-turn-helix transcriptional regulator [Priestia aryabhattai]MBU3568668.1 helix-turn-helix transcriptional regulator [Priestia aryabhattai]WJN47586.1 helix-turn-helix transcriptional regulator [Priestia aryabhattai]